MSKRRKLPRCRPGDWRYVQMLWPGVCHVPRGQTPRSIGRSATPRCNPTQPLAWKRECLLRHADRPARYTAAGLRLRMSVAGTSTRCWSVSATARGRSSRICRRRPALCRRTRSPSLNS